MYKVFWQVLHHILVVELEGQLSLDDFSQINRTVLNHLDSASDKSPIILLINTEQLRSVPQAFQQLRESQVYIERHDLRYIIVVGKNKMIRLMMLLTFNLSRPPLRFVDELRDANKLLQILESALH